MAEPASPKPYQVPLPSPRSTMTPGEEDSKALRLQLELSERSERTWRHRAMWYKERWLTTAGLIEVEGYERADGTEVTEHYRRKRRV